MSNIDEIKIEFDSAVAVARHALAEFRRQPLVPSKRGGPRLSPWWASRRQRERMSEDAKFALGY
jgi:hypothetical protein